MKHTMSWGLALIALAANFPSEVIAGGKRHKERQLM